MSNNLLLLGIIFLNAILASCKFNTALISISLPFADLYCNKSKLFTCYIHSVHKNFVLITTCPLSCRLNEYRNFHSSIKHFLFIDFLFLDEICRDLYYHVSFVNAKRMNVVPFLFFSFLFFL